MATSGSFTVYMAGEGEAERVRVAVSRVAADLGFAARVGPAAGRGGPAALLRAIADGDARVVMLADSDRRRVVAELRRLADQSGAGPELLRLADALA